MENVANEDPRLLAVRDEARLHENHKRWRADQEQITHHVQDHFRRHYHPTTEYPKDREYTVKEWKPPSEEHFKRPCLPCFYRERNEVNAKYVAESTGRMGLAVPEMSLYHQVSRYLTSMKKAKAEGKLEEPLPERVEFVADCSPGTDPSSMFKDPMFVMEKSEIDRTEMRGMWNKLILIKETDREYYYMDGSPYVEVDVAKDRHVFRDMDRNGNVHQRMHLMQVSLTRWAPLMYLLYYTLMSSYSGSAIFDFCVQGKDEVYSPLDLIMDLFEKHFDKLEDDKKALPFVGKMVFQSINVFLWCIFSIFPHQIYFYNDEIVTLLVACVYEVILFHYPNASVKWGNSHGSFHFYHEIDLVLDFTENPFADKLDITWSSEKLRMMRRIIDCHVGDHIDRLHTCRDLAKCFTVCFFYPVDEFVRGFKWLNDFTIFRIMSTYRMPLMQEFFATKPDETCVNEFTQEIQYVDLIKHKYLDDFRGFVEKYPAEAFWRKKHFDLEEPALACIEKMKPIYEIYLTSRLAITVQQCKKDRDITYCKLFEADKFDTGLVMSYGILIKANTPSFDYTIQMQAKRLEELGAPSPGAVTKGLLKKQSEIPVEEHARIEALYCNFPGAVKSFRAIPVGGFQQMTGYVDSDF